MKAFLSVSKAEQHSSEKCQGYLPGKMHEQNGDLGISMNEMTVVVGETEEGLDVLDLLGF